jgi:hypothetical protein
VLKLNKLNYDEAESCCNGLCGHLASYISQEEQYEVRSVQAGQQVVLHNHCTRARPSQVLLSASCSASPWPPLQVEDFYISNGYLLPGYHRHYWLGATATTWPKFNWTDITIPPMDKGYRHWGTLVPDGVKEPYQVEPPEFCAVANYTETYGKPCVFGWSDTGCGKQYYPMCRINSERR